MDFVNKLPQSLFVSPAFCPASIGIDLSTRFLEGGCLVTFLQPTAYSTFGLDYFIGQTQ